LNRYDENHLKDTDNFVTDATLAMYPATNAEANVGVPVLIETGIEDPFFCGLVSADCTSSATLLSHERAFYPNSPAVEAYAAPHAGHGIELERAAPAANRRIITFVDAHVGPGTGLPRTAPGIRPAPVPVPVGTPSLAGRLINAPFVAAALPLSDAYIRYTRRIPGLGTRNNPVPAATAALAAIARLDVSVAPTAQRILGGH
jgi:hypothetical protein